MDYYAGLDVAVEETAICVVDSAGEIVAETTVKTEPDAIAAALETYRSGLKRVGHEAGSLAPWLQHQLQAVGIPIICLETRHAHAALGAMRNKTDRNDARGLAQIMRSGWFRAVHIKSDESYRLRLLLTHRRLLKRKFLDVENGLRHSLKAFGIKVGKVSRARFEPRVRELVGDDPVLVRMADSLLRARAALWSEYLQMHKLLLRVVRNDELCRRFMRVPGVGPVTALSFKTGVDNPHRFRRSKTVGAHFGMTPKRHQSGNIDWQGRISKCGDGEVRTALYEAASSLLSRVRAWSQLKAWGMKIARHRGYKKAVVAVARKLSMILHRMWLDGTEFRWGKAPSNVSSDVSAAA